MKSSSETSTTCSPRTNSSGIRADTMGVRVLVLVLGLRAPSTSSDSLGRSGSGTDSGSGSGRGRPGAKHVEDALDDQPDVTAVRSSAGMWNAVGAPSAIQGVVGIAKEKRQKRSEHSRRWHLQSASDGANDLSCRVSDRHASRELCAMDKDSESVAPPRRPPAPEGWTAKENACSIRKIVELWGVEWCKRGAVEID